MWATSMGDAHIRVQAARRAGHANVALKLLGLIFGESFFRMPLPSAAMREGQKGLYCPARRASPSCGLVRTCVESASVFSIVMADVKQNVAVIMSDHDVPRPTSHGMRHVHDLCSKYRQRLAEFSKSL